MLFIKFYLILWTIFFFFLQNQAKLHVVYFLNEFINLTDGEGDTMLSENNLNLKVTFWQQLLSSQNRYWWESLCQTEQTRYNNLVYQGNFKGVIDVTKSVTADSNQ